MVLYRITNPWFRFSWLWNMTSKGRKWNRLIAKMHAFTREIISERERQMRVNSAMNANYNAKNTNKRRKVFLDLLLEMKADGKLNIENVREEVDTFMFEVCMIPAIIRNNALLIDGGHNFECITQVSLNNFRVTTRQPLA